MCSEAQTIVLCEFCDSGKPVRWTCVNCLDDLCDWCKRVHERLKATRHHEIQKKSKTFEKRLESRCAFHQDICTFYCPKCNELLCTKCVTDKHLGHKLQEIELIHGERKKGISDTICKIQDLQKSNVSDRYAALQKLRGETKGERNVLRNEILTQKIKIEKEINSATDRLLNKVDQFYDLEEMRQSQICTELNDLKECLEQQGDNAETLLSSNDTRRFIGDEIGGIEKSLLKIIEYKFPKEMKRASFAAKQIDPSLLDNLLGTVQFPSFIIPDNMDKGAKTILTLQYISKFDNLRSVEIIRPIDPHNVWVRNKVSGTVHKWKRTDQTQVAEDSNMPEELIAINVSDNAIEAISEDGDVREIQKYEKWRPRCVHVDGDLITLGLTDDRTDFDAVLYRFHETIKSPRRIIGFLQNHIPGLPEFHDQRAMVVQMKTNGETLLTYHFQNDNGCYGKMCDLIFCASNNMHILTLEKRDLRWYLFKRDSTGEIINYCNLPILNPKEGGVVCTSLGIVLVLDFNDVVHFINNELEFVSKLCLNDVKICSAEKLFLDKYDRIWIKGRFENEACDTTFITGLSSARSSKNTCVLS